MRYLVDHIVTDPTGNRDATQDLVIGVLDEPGHGGANHVYAIEAGEASSMLQKRTRERLTRGVEGTHAV